MTEVLKIENLVKKYPEFTLDQVSFSVEQGQICGYIGRNGAGKTTTLKSIINMVHPDSGTIEIGGYDFKTNELKCKESVGLVFGSFQSYKNKKLDLITSVYKRFYDTWDDSLYQKWISMFKLDGNKTINQLSEGMKVKYALAIALSHNAKLLILDEPTSGLDPVSRSELLDTFIYLVDHTNCGILYSTHITSDLEQCADKIVYIKEGHIILDMNKENVSHEFKVIKGADSAYDNRLEGLMFGCRRQRGEFQALIKAKDIGSFSSVEVSDASLENIMVYMDREGNL